jgi:transcriptional regulator with XRE-family HTH domain
MTTIGNRVRELRKSKGLSQQALTGDGISAGYVSLIESGKRTPSPEVTAKLAERLGVPLTELTELGGDEERAASSESAQLDVNFARLALANGTPAEAVRSLRSIPLEGVAAATANEASLTLAEALEQTGEVDEALRVLETLLGRCRREHTWLTYAVAATMLAVMLIEAGDVARSVEIAERSLREIEEVGLRGTDEHLRLGSILVSALYERGDLLVATHHIEALIQDADRMSSARGRGAVYWTAATVAAERDRVADAIRLTDRAVALFAEQDQSRDLPRLRLNYAWLLLKLDNPRPAEALIQLELAERDPALAGATLDLGTAATFRGRAHLLMGDLLDAAEQAACALQILGPSAHVERASALLLLGDVGTAQLEMDLAQESYREAELVLARMAPSRTVARLWRELGDSWRALGERDRAMSAFDCSLRTLGIAPRPTAVREASTRQGSYSVAR